MPIRRSFNSFYSSWHIN